MDKTYLIKLAAITGLLLFSAMSWAGCYVSGGAYYYSVTMPVQNFTIPRNKAVGTALGGPTLIPDNYTNARNITCNGGQSYTYLRFGPATPLTESAFPGIYETNVPGIGIKVWDNHRGTVILGNALKQWYALYGNPHNSNSWLTNIWVQYYIIGPVTPGTVNSRVVVETWANNTATTYGGANYVVLTIRGSAVVNVSACETPDVSVDLNKHGAEDFLNVGSTSPATEFKFRINNCGAGMATVSYTFKPGPGITLNGSGASQYLSLSSSSTASGVGVQVLYDGGTQDGQPVPFNTKTRFTGYTSTRASSYIIPMKARYIRTGDIVGGTANSSVEFSMLYE